MAAFQTGQEKSFNNVKGGNVIRFFLLDLVTRVSGVNKPGMRGGQGNISGICSMAFWPVSSSSSTSSSTSQLLNESEGIDLHRHHYSL